MTTPTSVIILAAGKGTRMKSNLPKVLHSVGHLPMLFHVTRAGSAVNPQHIIAVVGHGSNKVEESCKTYCPELELVLQEEQLGTGHAVMQAEEVLSNFEGDIIILTGDCPLMTKEMVRNLLTAHQMGEYAITFLSADINDPTGLGRVKRNHKNDVTGIVEHKDATDTELDIKEINTGLYVVKSSVLFELLKRVNNENSQGEYYLPDIIPLALQQNLTVGTAHTEDGASLLGVNSRAQLAFAEGIFQQRERDKAMENGVTLQAPESVYFSWDTTIENETFIGPNVRFMEGVEIAQNCVIEGSCYLKNCVLEQGSTLKPFCYIEDTIIASGRTTEPFTCIAPDANIINKITSIS
jgi:bifunctional UDP-N-acetylglucosamine pyrophosphorylase/glucosamine-1-phosphate N-acetyltransferase